MRHKAGILNLAKTEETRMMKVLKDNHMRANFFSLESTFPLVLIETNDGKGSSSTHFGTC